MQPASEMFVKGSYLFKENDLSKEMYIVQSGLIRITKNKGNQKVEICRLGKGAVLGEMALIDGQSRSANAEVLEDAQVSIITPEDFTQKTKGIPPWIFSIIRIIIQRLRNSNKRLEGVIDLNHTGNVATLLHLIYIRHKEKSGDEEVVDLKRAKKEIMTILGTSREELNDCFNLYVADGMIQVENNKIRIPDIHKFGRYGRYLRIKLNIQEESLISLSDDTKIFIGWIGENREKHGKACKQGTVFNRADIEEEMNAILKDKVGFVLEELTEKNILVTENDKETDEPAEESNDKENKGPALIVNDQRLLELALFEEFEKT